MTPARIPKDLLPANLRQADTKVQLLYLYQRRSAIEKLLKSLESYAEQRDALLRKKPGVETARAKCVAISAA
jgi:hypothetical protein